MKFTLPPLFAPLLQQLNLSRKIGLSICTALLAGVLLLSASLSHEQDRFSEKQLMMLGQALAQQTSQSAVPLILANDELSLSIVLQQLIQLEQVQGAEILSGSGEYLSRAGKPSEMNLNQSIKSEQVQLGTLRLHLNPTASGYRLSELLPMSLAALVGLLLLVLIALMILSRHLGRPAQALANSIEQINHGHRPPALDDNRHDELGPMMQLLNQHFTEPGTQTPSSTEPEVDSQPEQQPDLENSTETDTSVEPTSSTPSTPTLKTDSTSADTDDGLEAVPAQQPLQANDSLPTEPEALQVDGPDSSETSASPRGYLFYVNHHVGGSDTLTTTEREQLLTRYHSSLQQVARLYKGNLEEDVLGNWCVRFSPLSEDQSHGINALCAAQLFNALYRGINSQAIHNFSPALNMKLVLLSGQISEFDRLAEDALLLSDQIQENDLITHIELYRIEELQQRLLDSASYRKFDEDTLLIASLNRDYQSLIDQQAEHFLKQST